MKRAAGLHGFAASWFVSLLIYEEILLANLCNENTVPVKTSVRV